MNRLTAPLIAALLMAACAFPALAERIPMNAVDMVELTRPSAPQLSPDGRFAVYLRSETNWTTNKSTRQLYLVDTKSAENRPLFDKRSPTESHSEARWSPDGSQLLTTLKRKDDKHKQVYRYTLSNGALERLTEFEADVTKAEWSVGGEGVYLLTTQAKSAERKKKKDWFLEEYEAKPRSEIWYVELASGDIAPVVQGDFFVRSFVESNDGTHQLYTRADHGRIDRPGAELWLRDVKNQTERQITRNRFAERFPMLSPDNRYVAFIATVNERGEQYYEDNLFVQSIDTGDRELLLGDKDMEIDRFAWAPDGQSIYLTANTGLRSELYRYTLATGDLQALTSGDHVVTHWHYSPAADRHVYVMRDAHQPGELFTLNAAGESVRLTHDHAELEATRLLPVQEAITWRSKGGATIEGLLIYPLGYVKGAPDAKPFPLVTISHGGPRSSAQFGSWNVSRYVPVLAAEGYGVLLPNYRGGHGYGDRFARSMVGNYFRHSHHDVLAGIDHVVKLGLADPDQLIKMGWSAGGHMTNKLITFTDRFKAASSGAGVADWISMYAESDVRYNRTPWFGGAPWQKNAPLKSYLKQSPLKDAWRITTPTLFWGGNKDVRVPPTQGIMMYRGAKAAGVDTELYLAPGQPHNFQRPTYKLFKINTELAWYARHLKRPAYAPTYPDEFYEAETSELTESVD